MKKIVMLFFLLFTIFLEVANAQQLHNTTCKFCVYSKNRVEANRIGGADESCHCEPCRIKRSKEREAKQHEQKRKADALAAKFNAEKEAKLKALQAEQKREQEELAKKVKKEAEKKSLFEETRRNDLVVAQHGELKSTVRGKEIFNNQGLENIEVFSDKSSRTYGFKIDGSVSKAFPFESHNVQIGRIQNSNLFHVKQFSIHPKYGWDVYSHSFVIDRNGKRIMIDGSDEFDREIEVFENTIFLIKWLDTPRTLQVADDYCFNKISSIVTLYATSEAAEASIEEYRTTHGGLAMCYNAKVCHVNQYKLDLNGKLLEKVTGYQLMSFRN